MKSGALLLAWRYLSYYRGRTALLLAALTLTMTLPLAARWTVARFEQQSQQRAQSTPLVIGSHGSRFALVLHALSFRGEAPESIQYAELQRIEASGLARAIPLLVQFRAQGVAIVGTTDAYLDLRQLTLASGESWQRLGDCMLGANVARSLKLKVGDKISSDPQNAFDLSGPSPLNMRITGLLNPTGTADDDVVFCTLNTAWILQGIGHGHAAPKSESPAEATGDSTDSHLHAASGTSMPQATEITDENVRSFHFHGRRDQYPLTAIIAVPSSERSETLLLGQYLDVAETHQIVRPVEVMQELLQFVFNARRMFDAAAALLALATGLLVVLVVLLSLRLRARELQLFALLGCSRLNVARVIAYELFIVLAASLALATVVAWWASHASDWLMVAFPL